MTNKNSKLFRKNLTSKTLAVIVLNVGDGDAIIVNFPSKYGEKTCAVIDCYNADKTIAALKKLQPKKLSFICATHPHYDHTAGIAKLIKWCLSTGLKIEEFWDSGFRHVSQTHYDIIHLLRENSAIKIFRPTSGFETVINKVRVLVLSPSIYLKNRYDTYGTNINNASIVIKLEYPPMDMAPFYKPREVGPDKGIGELEELKQGTIILGGDAQFDSWARVTQEFPELQRTKNRGQLINAEVRKFQPLRCQVLKVPHHMSKHGVTLEVLETLHPRYTLASCSKKSRHKFPHELTVMAAEDIHSDKPDKGIRFTGHRDPALSGGTIAVLFKENGKNPLVYSLGDTVSQNAPL